MALQNVTFTFNDGQLVTGTVTTTQPPPPVPTLSAITPSSFPANTPTTVTVTGTNFPLGAGGAIVNGQTSGFNVTNPTSFQVILPGLP
jgi:hypothetical protein